MKQGLLQPIKVVLLAVLSGFSLGVSAQTTTFPYTGGVQTYTVPLGVTSLTFVIEAGAGGESAWDYFGTVGYSEGGYADHITGTVNVTPGSILDIYVGGVGANGVGLIGGTGGYNGGANGVYVYSGGNFAGGGGGGASDIRVAPYGLANRIIVAGAGGGAGSDAYPIDDMNGGNGGVTGGTGYWDGITTTGHGGNGATVGAPGTGGIFPGWGSGAAGTLAVGGIAGSPSGGGGGGGGNYGGGGGSWGGGGGGSSYTDALLTTGVVHTMALSHTTSGTVSLTPNTPPINSIPYFVHGDVQTLHVCENSTPTSINTLMTIIDSNVGNIETWTIILNPVHGALSGFPTTATSTGTTPTTPAGLTYQPTAGYSGPDSFRIQVADGMGGFDTTTVVITVDPIPAVGPISGPSSVCVSANITLTDPAPGGTWTSTFGYASIVPTTGVVTGVSAGTEHITYTISNSCGTVTATYPVTVNALANPGTIVGPASVCVGWTITETDAVTGGAWSATNGKAIIAPTGIVTGVAVGLDTIAYSVSNLCGVSTTTQVINIITLPNPGTITGPANVCVGSTITLTDAVAGGIWTGSNSRGTVSLSGDISGTTIGLDTIMYAVTNVCGVSTATKTVTVINVPVVNPITGSSTVCNGSTTTLADATPGGIWARSNSSVSVTSGGVVTGVAVGTSVISYTVTNTCGATTVTKGIQVLISPSDVTITGDTVVCPDKYDPFTASITGGIWSIANTHAYIDETGVVGGVYEGADTVLYTVTNSCGTGSVKFAIWVLSDSICSPLKVHSLSAGEATMKVYPNPNDGAFTMLLSSGINEEVLVTITNVVGEKVLSTTTTTNKATDIKLNVPAGIYLLNAATPHGRYVSKVTVE